MLHKALKSLILLIFTGPSLAFCLSGQLKTSADAYPDHLGAPTQDLIPYLSLELSGKTRFNRQWRLQWKGLAMSNLVTQYQPEKFYGDVPELFIEFKPVSWFKLRPGLNTVNWGVVDINSPSDTVNTTALFHPLRSMKQGAPMVEAVLGDEAVSLDLIYIPWQRRPQLPSRDSRWLPRSFLIDVEADGQRFVLPKFVEYTWDHAETLDHALENNFGGKLASHLGSVDLQATYFRGAAPSAKAVPTKLEFDFGANANEQIVRSPIHLTPYSYLIETTGFGFVWAREKWIYRGETAYEHTLAKSELLQPWSWSSVLAVETNVDLSPSTLTLLAQYYYTRNPQAADNLISSSSRLFDRTALLGGRWAFSDNLTFLLSGLYEMNTRGLFWMCGFDHKIDDHLRWSLGWRDFSAERDGLIKTYERNDHTALEMTYFF